MIQVAHAKKAAATEHTDDDVQTMPTVETRTWKRVLLQQMHRNTRPRGSDATEPTATTEVMTTPAVDAATDDIAIGPCRLRCMIEEHDILCMMQEEIDRRFRVPVSLGQLLQRYDDARCDDNNWNRQSSMQSKSWSGIIEAISRCIAAFQKATDATEHSECQDIATKTCDYAIALTRKIPAHCDYEIALALVHQYMKNRTYNLAFTHLLNQVFLCEYEREDPFWSVVGDSSTVCGSQKEECLRIIEMCIEAIGNHADQLLRGMDAYRLR